MPARRSPLKKAAGVFGRTCEGAQGHFQDGAKGLTAHGGAALIEGGVNDVQSKKEPCELTAYLNQRLE